uniref:Uncharacterized protein n=1 Tax=Octopus bimaculoides TaxID=37653 RepID=A0A0L8H1T3_OCTBM
MLTNINSQKHWVLSFKRSDTMKIPDWVEIVKLGRYNELALTVKTGFIHGLLQFADIFLILNIPLVLEYWRTLRNWYIGHFCPVSASIARFVLQTVENFKFVQKDPNGGHRLTSLERRDLERIASQIKCNQLYHW